MSVNITADMGSMSGHLKTKRHKSAEEAVPFISKVISSKIRTQKTVFKFDDFINVLLECAFIHHPGKHDFFNLVKINFSKIISFFSNFLCVDMKSKVIIHFIGE